MSCIYCGKDIHDGVVCPHPKVNPAKQGVVCLTHCKTCKYYMDLLGMPHCTYWEKRGERAKEKIKATLDKR